MASVRLRPPHIERHTPTPRRPARWAAPLVLAAILACEAAPRAQEEQGPYRSEVDEGLGIAVAIVVDNSGSMEDGAPGDGQPKYEVAREAVREMLAATDSFVASRPDLPVKVALFHFAGRAEVVLPVQPYDAALVSEALDRIPFPDGSTAIGRAMRLATEELYRSGVFRKYMVVITDGENTAGPDPAEEAAVIHRRSGRSVRMHFVAFDTDPAKFGFLREVDGGVLAAADAASLREGLDELYRREILAEAPKVEPPPQEPDSAR